MERILATLRGRADEPLELRFLFEQLPGFGVALTEIEELAAACGGSYGQEYLALVATAYGQKVPHHPRRASPVAGEAPAVGSIATSPGVAAQLLASNGERHLDGPDGERIIADPDRGWMIPGAKARFHLQLPPRLSADWYHTGHWTVVHELTDGTQMPPAFLSNEKTCTVEAKIPGTHTIVCRIQFHSGHGTTKPPIFIAHRYQVANAASIASAATGRSSESARADEQAEWGFDESALQPVGSTD